MRKSPVIDLRVTCNPVGPSQRAKQAIRKDLRRLGDPSGRGIELLRRAVCRRAGIESGQLLLGHGARHLIGLLIRTCAISTVLHPWPFPRHLKEMVQSLGVAARETAPQSGPPYVMEKEALLQGAPGAHMVIVPHPHRITGGCLSPEDLTALAMELTGSDAVLLIDETLREFGALPSSVPLLPGLGKSIVLGDFSPYHSLTTLRLGYVIGPGGMVDALRAHADEDEVSPLAALAAAASLQDKGLRRRTEAFLREEKAFLMKTLGRLPGLEILDTGVGSLLVVAHADPADVVSGLAARGLVVESAVDAGGRTLIAVPVSSHRINARLARTLKRIAGV